MDLPEDKISLKEAGALAGVTDAAVRGWIRAGHIQRYEGAPPPSGGSPRAWVSRAEVRAYLVTSGRRPPAPPEPAEAADAAAEVQVVSRGEAGADAGEAAAVTIATLEGELALAREQGDRKALEAELAGAKALQLAAEARAAELRLLLAEERERVKGLEAELRALRAAQGLPWWRRLLGTAPAIEAPPIDE